MHFGIVFMESHKAFWLFHSVFSYVEQLNVLFMGPVILPSSVSRGVLPGKHIIV